MAPRSQPAQQPPPQGLPPGTVADRLGIAAGVAATAGAAAPVAAGIVSVAAAARAAAQILHGFKLFHRHRRKGQAEWLRRALRTEYPQRTAVQIDELVAEEMRREFEFQRKAMARMERDLPKALRIEDPEKRLAAIEKILDREERYVRMREDAMIARSSAAAELYDVKIASPEGAYWKLDPSVKQHTLDCLLMGEKFWPWEVLDHFHPLLHVGCACHLMTKAEAVERGLLSADYKIDVADAITSAHAIMRRAGHIQETAEPEEVEAFIQELLEEARPSAPQKCKTCEKPATKSLIWAEGAAYVPVCDAHEAAMREKLGAHAVNRVVLIEARKSNPAADRETERIKLSKETPEAKRVHKFKPAVWTHPNGHPRCRICGQEESISPECNREPTPEEHAAFAKKLNREFGAGKGGDRVQLSEDPATYRKKGRARSLVEARYAERYAKGDPRGGKFKPHGAVSVIRAEIKRSLRQLVPEKPVAPSVAKRAPLQERGKAQGRYAWLRERYVFIPRHRDFRRKLDHVVFHSPTGGTNIYRNGHLVQIEGEPLPHHHDLNPPKAADVRNIPGTAEYDPGVKLDPGTAHGDAAFAALIQQEDARNSLAGRVEEALRVQKKAWKPVEVGDSMPAVADVLEAHGFVSDTEVIHRRGDPIASIRFRHTLSGATVSIGWNVGGEFDVRWVEWHPGRDNWLKPPRPASHVPRTWEEFADEVRGVAFRLAHEHDQEPVVGEVVTNPDPMSDHAGTHNSYSGQIRLGVHVQPDVLGLARIGEQGLDLNPEEARGAYAGYKVGVHEALHAVNVISGPQYQGAGKALEEALTEELAHVEMAKLLRAHGATEVLGWARQHPVAENQLGSYRAYRAQLDQILNVARIAPEEREDFLRKLKFDTPIHGRESVLMEAVAKGATDPRLRGDARAAHGWVRRVLGTGEIDAQGQGTPAVRADLARFAPIVRADLRDFPTADGVEFNGRRATVGSTVLYRSNHGEHEAQVLTLAQASSGVGFKLTLSDLETGKVRHNVLDSQVLRVTGHMERDQNAAFQAGEDVPGLDLNETFLIGGKRASLGATVRFKEGAGGRPGREMQVVGSQWGNVLVIDPERPELRPMEMPTKADLVEIVREGPEPMVVRPGDLIRYDGRADGGESEARVVQVIPRQFEARTDLAADAPRYVIEAITTENSLKPDTVVHLTAARTNGLHIAPAAVQQLPARVPAPEPIAKAADPGWPGYRQVAAVPGPDTGIHSTGGYGPSEVLRDQIHGTRQEGHFGTGFYFVSHRDKLTGGYEPPNLRPEGEANRQIVGLDLRGKNLYRPGYAKQAYRVHDLLRDLNSLAIDDQASSHVGTDPLLGRSYTVGSISRALALELGRRPGEVRRAARNAWKQGVRDVADDRATAELPSTRLLRALGYDGVDVRHIEALDHVGMGSVLFQDEAAAVKRDPAPPTIRVKLPPKMLSELVALERDTADGSHPPHDDLAAALAPDRLGPDARTKGATIELSPGTARYLEQSLGYHDSIWEDQGNVSDGADKREYRALQRSGQALRARIQKALAVEKRDPGTGARVVPDEAAARAWLAEGDAKYRELLYHGTGAANLPTIHERGMLMGPPEDEGNTRGGGVWLTDSRAVADSYAGLLDSGDPAIARVAVKLRKPLVVGPDENAGDVMKRAHGDRRASAFEHGYDGVVKHYAAGDDVPLADGGTIAVPGYSIVKVFDLDAMRVIRAAGDKADPGFRSQVPNDQAVYIAEGAMERGGFDGGRYNLAPSHLWHPDEAKRADAQKMTDLAREISGDQTLSVMVTSEPVWGTTSHVIAAYDRAHHKVAIRPDATKLSFLHEIAHAMTRTQHDEGHSPEFIRTAHELYAKHIGPEAAAVFWNLVGDRAGVKADPGSGNPVAQARSLVHRRQAEMMDAHERGDPAAIGRAEAALADANDALTKLYLDIGPGKFVPEPAMIAGDLVPTDWQVEHGYGEIVPNIGFRNVPNKMVPGGMDEKDALRMLYHYFTGGTEGWLGSGKGSKQQKAEVLRQAIERWKAHHDEQWRANHAGMLDPGWPWSTADISRPFDPERDVLYRGVRGQDPAAAAAASREGALGGGDYGRGIYLSRLPGHASGYAQSFSGDKTGVVLRAKLSPDAKVATENDLPKGTPQREAADWAAAHGFDAYNSSSYVVVTNPAMLTWDPQNYTASELSRNTLAHDYPGYDPGVKADPGSGDVSARHDPFARQDEIMRALGAHELEFTQSMRPDLYMVHPRSGYSVRNDTPRPHVIPNYGQPPRIEDVAPPPHRMGDEVPVPGSERPPKYVFRAVTEDDYQQALKRGYLQSDGRMNLAAREGTVAALSDPTWYLPGRLASDPLGDYYGRVLRIKYEDSDGWLLDTDSYVKTPKRIPMDRVDAAPQFVTMKTERTTAMGNTIPDMETRATGVGLEGLDLGGTKADPGSGAGSALDRELASMTREELMAELDAVAKLGEDRRAAAKDPFLLGLRPAATDWMTLDEVHRLTAIQAALVPFTGQDRLDAIERVAAKRAARRAANAAASVEPEPASLTREQFNVVNPSFDWPRETRAARFDALPDDTRVWLYHATSWKDDAERWAREGIDPSTKQMNVVRARFERGERAEFQPGAGAGGGLYVGFDPRAVEGYGRYIVAVRVRKGDVKAPPEQQGASPGQALFVADAHVEAPIPASDVRLIGDAARGVPVGEQRIPGHPHDEFVKMGMKSDPGSTPFSPEQLAAAGLTEKAAREELALRAEWPQYDAMTDQELLDVQHRLSQRIHGNSLAGVKGIRDMLRDAGRGGDQPSDAERESWANAEARYKAINQHIAARRRSAEFAREEQARLDAAEKGVLTVSRDEMRQMLGQPGDRYADLNYSGEYNPDMFIRSDLSGAMIRHYVKLPDGRIAHPDELHDARKRGRLVVVEQVAPPRDRPRYLTDRLGVKADPGAGAPAPTVLLADSRSSRGGHIRKPATFLRFGDLPTKHGVPTASQDWLGGGQEAGVSVYAAWRDPKTGTYVLPSGSEQYLATQAHLGEERASSIYEVLGADTGERGADGEPLLDPGSLRLVRQVAPDAVVNEQDPWLALDGSELPPAQVPDWHDVPPQTWEPLPSAGTVEVAPTAELRLEVEAAAKKARGSTQEVLQHVASDMRRNDPAYRYFVVRGAENALDGVMVLSDPPTHIPRERLPEDAKLNNTVVLGRMVSLKSGTGRKLLHDAARYAAERDKYLVAWTWPDARGFYRGQGMNMERQGAVHLVWWTPTQARAYAQTLRESATDPPPVVTPPGGGMDGAGLPAPGPVHLLLEALGVPEDEHEETAARLLALDRRERLEFVSGWLGEVRPELALDELLAPS